jgi:hypothetical protein
MVGLAHAVYNPRPDESQEGIPDPSELCSPAFQERGEIEAHLFDAFIPAAYRRAGRWQARQARHWLMWLALRMEEGETLDLAWWKLWRLCLPRYAMPLTAAVLFGVPTTILLITIVIVTHESGLGIAPILGIVSIPGLVGLIFWLLEPGPPSRGITLRPSAALFALASGGAVSLAFRFSPPIHIAIGTRVIKFSGNSQSAALLLAFALAFALLTLLMYGFSGRPENLERAVSPRVVRNRDRAAALLLIIGFPLALAPPDALATQFFSTSGSFPRIGVLETIALTVPFSCLMFLTLGFMMSFPRMAWPAALLGAIWLGAHRFLPWSVMDFLDDAHRRGVLRQSGSTYQFRHQLLQKRLADWSAYRLERPPWHYDEGHPED